MDVGSSGIKVTSGKIDTCNRQTVGQLTTERTSSNLTISLQNGILPKKAIDFIVELINKVISNNLNTKEKTTSFFLSGTAAFREATNKQEVLRKIHEGTGLHLHVLHPDEEARFAVISASHYLHSKNLIGQERPVVLDTGGGSFQLSYTLPHGKVKTSSFPIGSDVFLKAYLEAEGQPTFSHFSYESCTKAQKVAKRLMNGFDLPKEITDALESKQPILTVARMFSFSVLPLTGSSNHFSPVQAISLGSVNTTLQKMLGLSYEDIAKAHPSVNQKSPHADVFNLIFAQALMEKLGVDTIYSAKLDSSLQGVLYENDASWQKLPHNNLSLQQNSLQQH